MSEKYFGRWVTSPIETVQIEHSQHRIRRLAHKILPKLVAPPPPQHEGEIRPGDKVRFPSGRAVRVNIVVPSAEGVRYAFSDTPHPDFRPAHEPTSTSPEQAPPEIAQDREIIPE